MKIRPRTKRQKGVLIETSGRDREIADGPFAQAEEVVGGFALMAP